MNGETKLADAEEITRLNRCIRDIAALTALPALWTNCDSGKVIDSLADVLLGMLGLDFIYISVATVSDKTSIKIGRTKNLPRGDGQAEAIEKSFEAARIKGSAQMPTTFPDPWDLVETDVAVLPFRVDNCDSILIAGKRQAAFPSKTDQLLLRTGINQATVLLKRISAENALKEQANQFDLVLSSITDLAYSFDIDGRLIFANKPLLDLWKLSLDEAKGRNFLELYNAPTAAEKLQRQIQQVIQSKQSLMDEMPYISVDGTTRYYQYIFSPSIGADDRANGIVGTSRDVSDLKQAEARDKFLVQLDSELRPLTDPREMTMAAATLLGRHLGVDRCAYADIEDDQDTMNLFGNYLRSAEIKSIVGKLKFQDFGAEVLRLMRENKPFVVHDIDTHQPAVSKYDAYRATQIQAVICVPLHKNGRFVAAMAVHQSRPRQWTQKEVELVLHVASRCWESIERSRIERDLGEKYSSLFMQAPLAICVLDGPKHVFRLANPSYLSLISAGNRQLIGKPVVEALPEIEGQGFAELLDQVYQSGIPYFGKEVAFIAEGEEGRKKLYVDFIYQPRFNSQRVVDGILVVATDVTEKVQTRLNLEGAIQELRATTKENKRLLEEMRQYAEALVDTDRRKDEFLATLAHELRNPLAPIKNSLEILRNARDEAKVEKLRHIMDGQLTHLIRLVDDLLDMSRINEGKIELRKERLTIQSAIQTAVEASAWQIDAQKHELVVDIPVEPLWVAADATRLTQVINNLLNNAGKYTPGGGKITLAARSEGLMGIIEIADNGIGIPPEMLDRIFEPFTQMERSRQHSQGGLGIGLSLVKRLMEMHGGFVRVTSAGTNKGSTFTVGVPVADEQGAAAPQPAPGRATHGETKKLKILVVDDNIDSAQTIGWMLEINGHQPCLAHNGKEALALALEQHPEVILLDIGLPDISGYEVCRELRKIPGFKNTLIVAQTGWGQKRDRDMSHAAGFNQHLVKPVQLEDLSQLLSTYGAELTQQ